MIFDAGISSSRTRFSSNRIPFKRPSEVADAVAHPPILEPELGHKEAENVENSTVLAKSVKWRSTLLETICGIISELVKNDVTSIKGNDLKRMIDDVNEINNLKVEVVWLQTRLTGILEARQILKQSRTLKEKKDSIIKFIEIAESELKECEAEKKELSEKLKVVCDKEADWKKRLVRMHDESTKTFKRIKDGKSKVRQFLNGSLVDDLI
ncbi:plant phospholipase-like protein [Medicago truncatula]|uniref:Plant phospholipase-like protein n=1 Tax=Medicago truncatula TaxID=3880 RepID=G7L9N2_MEDTR|nr:plant phospholipase-like protein [Medicago truncatula]